MPTIAKITEGEFAGLYHVLRDIDDQPCTDPVSERDAHRFLHLFNIIRDGFHAVDSLLEASDDDELLARRDLEDWSFKADEFCTYFDLGKDFDGSDDDEEDGRAVFTRTISDEDEPFEDEQGEEGTYFEYDPKDLPPFSLELITNEKTRECFKRLDETLEESYQRRAIMA